MLKKLIIIIVTLLVISAFAMSVSGLLDVTSDRIVKIEKDSEKEFGDDMYTLTIQAAPHGYDEFMIVYANGEKINVSDESGYEGVVQGNCFLGYDYDESSLNEILSHFNNMQGVVVVFEPYPEFDLDNGYLYVNGVNITHENMNLFGKIELPDEGCEVTVYYYQVPLNTSGN